MKILLFNTYINTIKKSVDSKIFQNLWIENNGKKIDATKNGKSSCALFVSRILIWFGLINRLHATVAGTIKDIEKNGWHEIKEPKKGCLIYWGEWNQGGSPSEHIGFYIGNKEAISNNWKTKTPQKHNWKYGKLNRKIKKLYWNDKLNE
jgi:hypothetical protein